MIGCQASFFTFFIAMIEAHMIANILNIADPTIVPAHRLSFHHHPPNIAKIANIEVNNSGALLPIAIKVAQVTSDDNFNLFDILSKASTKYLSQIIANR